MKPVERKEIIDYVTYEEQRDAVRDEAMAAKALRRVHIGEYLTLLFENHLTMRYQIQEMVRVERLVKEADIQHEIDTYNEVLGGEGEFGCTLLIEIDDVRSHPFQVEIPVESIDSIADVVSQDFWSEQQRAQANWCSKRCQPGI